MCGRPATLSGWIQRERGLEWGDVDEAGALVVQGASGPLGTEAQSEHVLEIRIQSGAAWFMLDGREIASSVPLRTAQGYVGLLSGPNPVAFDDVRFTFNERDR